jgi:hypothetical protein
MGIRETLSLMLDSQREKLKLSHGKFARLLGYQDDSRSAYIALRDGTAKVQTYEAAFKRLGYRIAVSLEHVGMPTTSLENAEPMKPSKTFNG